MNNRSIGTWELPQPTDLKEDDEWIKSLEMLIKNPDIRKKLGENARKTVIENYSTDVVGSQYLAILNSLIGDKDGR